MAGRFDDLTRILGSGLNRRDALRLSVATVAGSYLSLVWPKAAWAEQPRQGGVFCLPTFTLKNGDKVCGVSEAATEDMCSQDTCCGFYLDGGAKKARKCCTTDKDCACCKQDEICCGNRASAHAACCPSNQGCDEDTGRCCAEFCGPAKHCCAACEDCTNGECKTAADRCGTGQHCCENLHRPGFHCCPAGMCCGEINDKCGSVSKTQNKSRIAAVTANQMTVVIQDDQGVGSITVLKADNAQVDIPAFEPGTTDPITVVATKLDLSKAAAVELSYCPAPGCGCTTCCHVIDPVAATLQIPPRGRRARQSFAAVAAAERYLTVQNGRPGLDVLRIDVDGQRAAVYHLAEDEVRVVDLARHLHGDDNLVTLAAQGLPQGSALLVLGDTPAVGRVPGTAVVLPRIDWQPPVWRQELEPSWMH